MKHFKLFFAAALTFTCLMTPVKKANAGLILSMANPASMVGTVIFLSGWTTGMASWLTGYVRQEAGVYGPLDKYLTAGFFGGMGVAVLNEEMDGLQHALEEKYPSLPPYIISEAIYTLEEKAEMKEFNQDGLKSVSMEEAEFQALSQAMPRDVNMQEVESFKRLLTEKIEL